MSGSSSSSAEAETANPWLAAHRECDVVMKGGITSGVVYPLAICEIARNYRLRGVGGASAGAIGAAFAAAAESARATGGFVRLSKIPDDLLGGNLRQLFVPSRRLRPLFDLLLAGLSKPTPSKSGAAGEGGNKAKPVRAGLRVAFAALAGYPVASALGALPGLAVVLTAMTLDPWQRAVVACVGAVLVALGWVIAIVIRAGHMLLVDVPRNLFGICTGRSDDGGAPALTDWLHEQIQMLSGREHPLTFGNLRADGIDLRMVTTCLSQGSPYEMPWNLGSFFFDVETWLKLFPEEIVKSLRDDPPPLPSGSAEREEWRWLDLCAAQHSPPLVRFPRPDHLPVVVATRLSLSFPLLISAVPLWEVDRVASTDAIAKFHTSRRSGQRPRDDLSVKFTKLWFTDGGFCSNFPMPMFDRSMALRPTLAISLGRFPPSSGTDDSVNVSEEQGDQEIFEQSMDRSKVIRKSLSNPWTTYRSGQFGSIYLTRVQLRWRPFSWPGSIRLEIGTTIHT